MFSVLWVEKHSQFYRQFSTSLLPFPFIRTTDSAHFHYDRIGERRRAASAHRRAASAAAAAAKKLHPNAETSHSFQSLINAASCTSRKISERTKNTSRVRLNDLHSSFFSFFYVAVLSVLLLYIDRVHTIALFHQTTRCEWAPFEWRCVDIPCYIYWIYFFLRSLAWKTIRSMINYIFSIFFHIFRVTWITCIV